MTPADQDWLAICRRAAAGVEAALERYPKIADRSVATGGRGEGGDRTLVIDTAAEDAIFSELEAVGVGLTAVSEERGQVPIAGGGPIHVVIDPIDGSRNAKRRMPLHAVSIAVAEDNTMGGVAFGYVKDLGFGEEWWAQRGEGAYLDGERLPELPADAELELLALEMIRPQHVLSTAEALEATGAARLRAIGSVALSLCFVAAGRFDGLVTLADCRSVDAAAGQLIVREAGGAVAFPGAADDPLDTGLGLDMRSRLIAAATPALADRLTGVGAD
ncbi:MAG TPA: inositol monophosphatase family protein [Thermoleophilaceae bacterium]|nr:inositol monophosphatase family protein [Thermoleophilaceae bacterium]